MIEDAKLRELFRAESEEHLQHLDDALLQLEQAPTEQALLEEAFREAHSLKGAARMLGLSAIQAPAHRLEDQLNAARHNTAQINPQTLAQMALLLGEIRQLTLAALGQGEARERAAMAAPATSLAATDLAPPQRTAPVVPVQAGEPGAAAFRIDSVRVATQQLDALLTYSGELTVTGTRLRRRLTELDVLIELSQEWTRSKAVRRSSEAMERLTRRDAMLARLRADLAADSARLDSIADEIEGALRDIRLLPLSNVLRLFPRLVHDLGQEQGKALELLIEGDETKADKLILEQIKDPLMHLLRNAIDHGIESAREREQAGKPATATLCIKASQSERSISIEVSDDGRGLDRKAIGQAAINLGLVSAQALSSMNARQVEALIFNSGLSTSTSVGEISGRGVGMDVVRNNVQALKGRIELASTPGRGTRITLLLPHTLATMQVLLVQVNGHSYGLPLEGVRLLRTVMPTDRFVLEGRPAIQYRGRPILLARLADLLELAATGVPAAPGASSQAVVLGRGADAFAVLVDAFLGQQEVVLKPQSALLERLRNVSGATILDSGEICMLLNPQDLLGSLRRAPGLPAPTEPVLASRPKKTILLVEDSISIRTLEQRFLEDAGYQVVSAVDGMQAWHKLEDGVFDAVVSDIMMPNLSGLGLTERIRREARYADLPVILVTSLSSDEDRRHGLQAGANAYLVKSTFDQQVLLDCLQRLIG
jgi:two-component system chemotaxis sensor kinase CheA